MERAAAVYYRVNPTVPTADAVSYRQTDSGRFSYALIKTAPPKNSIKYIVKGMVAAVLTALQSTLRPGKIGHYRAGVKVAVALASRTASVVVFMPPAGGNWRTADEHQKDHYAPVMHRTSWKDLPC
ncbi:MAG: hypothetical protein ACLSCO_17420 [Gallintestinimicrobium sp.]